MKKLTLREELTKHYIDFFDPKHNEMLPFFIEMNYAFRALSVVGIDINTFDAKYNIVKRDNLFYLIDKDNENNQILFDLNKNYIDLGIVINKFKSCTRFENEANKIRVSGLMGKNGIITSYSNSGITYFQHHLTKYEDSDSYNHFEEAYDCQVKKMNHANMQNNPLCKSFWNNVKTSLKRLGIGFLTFEDIDNICEEILDIPYFKDLIKKCIDEDDVNTLVNAIYGSIDSFECMSDRIKSLTK